jgi:hypothetical protein
VALSGTFAADFSAFVKESEKATVALTDMEAAGAKVETSVNKSLTSMTASASTATASTVKLGTQSTNTFDNMASGLRTVDKSMAALGININPVINVLSELGTVAKGTAASLSLIEKASIVLAVAMAAWQVGKWIYDVAGLDKSFADLAATMQGKATPSFLAWQQRVEIGRGAILKGFQGDLMDTAGAMNFLSRQVDENAEKLNTGADRVQKWNKELNGATGGLDALIAEVEAGNSTVEEMAKHFNVSARAIEYLKKGLTDAAAATREQADADKKAADEAQRHADARQRLQDQMFGVDLIAKAQDYLAALGPIENLTRMSTDAQKSMNAVLGQAIDAYTRMGDVAPAKLREIYTATLPLVPMIEGLGAAFADVGKVAIPALDEVTKSLTDAKDETEKFNAETARMVDEWNKGIRPWDTKVTTDVNETTAAVGRLSVQMQDLGRVNQSVWESLVAGHQLMDAYREAGVATGMQTALGGYTFAQQRAVGVLPTSSAVGGNTLNVNVNNADAQGIASKLVTEMRHQGVRF